MNWILFDYGEVLSHPPSTEAGERFAAEFGVSVERFWPAYWRGRERYDRGAVDAAGFWRSVAEQLGTPVPEDLNRLVRLDQDAWGEHNPDVLALLGELARETPLAMLSNVPLELAAKMDTQPWATLFRHRFYSARLGLTKPDPRIFEQVCEVLSTRPADVLFIDDREVNVAAAASVGMRAVRFTGAEELRSQLGS